MSCGAFTEIQFVMNELVPDDLHGKRILDVGSGFGFWGWILRAHRQGNPHITGIEINEERLQRCSEVGMYDQLLKIDVRDWLPLEEYDLIIVSHIIEHLSKSEGKILINKMKVACKGMLIVTCPEGDTRSPLSENDPPDDEHISVWKKDDFMKMGMITRHMRFSHRSGRIVCLFERLWFWLKGLKRGGVLIGWWYHDESLP